MKPSGALLPALVLAACVPAADRMDAAVSSFDPDGHPGIWLSRGYGYVLDIGDDGVRLFHAAGAVCVREEDIGSSIVPHLDLVRLSNGGDTMVLSSVLDPFEYTFDRAPSLPAACTQTTPDTPAGNFEAFANFFAAHYAFFDLYGVDWAARVAAARGAVSAETTDGELFEIVRDLVAPLRDSHIKIVATVAGEPVRHDGNPGRTEHAIAALAARRAVGAAELLGSFRRAYWFDGIGAQLLRGEGVVAGNGRIQYGMVDDRIGYLAVVTMGGYVSGDTDTLHEELPALDAILEDAVRLFRGNGAEAVIVDLSINSGGYDFIGLAIAGRFAASSVAAFTRRTADDPGASDFTMFVEPASGSRFTGPVYLLTSDMTRSAAEIAALGMRALDNVTHIGERTAGAFSTVLPKRLPNGWDIGLSNELYTDHRGRVWEGLGIEPDVAVPVFDAEDPFRGHVEAVRTVVRRIAHDLASADPARGGQHQPPAVLP